MIIEIVNQFLISCDSQRVNIIAYAIENVQMKFLRLILSYEIDNYYTIPFRNLKLHDTVFYKHLSSFE